MTIDRPTIGYDAECRLCRRIAGRIGPTLRRHGFAVRPLQDAELADALGLTAGMLPDEFQFLRPGRRPLGGAPAIAAIAALLGLQ
ncbi:MAG: hypothetical protein H0W72_17105, partial [Planctomycetes bacterium]|nr:hypothetical protein [Planctomycetota bacterium]